MRKASAAPAKVGKNGTQSNNKGNEYYPLRQIRLLFLSGGAYTAKEINQLVGTNDARKFISMIRQEGMLIKDVRLDSGRKRYWHEPDSVPTLFDQL